MSAAAARAAVMAFAGPSGPAVFAISSGRRRLDAPRLAFMDARAYWTVAPGHGEIRTGRLEEPAGSEVLVEASASAVSRGTEGLVHRGEVPPQLWEVMRAPFQRGDLPGPVAYGYLSVGVVAGAGAEARDLLGRRVFCLHPHQDRYVVPASAVALVPDDVPDDRACLAGTVETAINALWDAGPRWGDRVAVVGAGMVGASVAALLARMPFQRLQVVDPDSSRSAVADALGVTLVPPQDAQDDCDIVIHASATQEGLATCLRLAGEDARIVELSWYGVREPSVPLGLEFHYRRLTLRASQVAAVALSRRARRSTADRLGLALDALRDARFDALVSGHWDFEELPQVMAGLACGTLPGLAHIVRYRR